MLRIADAGDFDGVKEMVLKFAANTAYKEHMTEESLDQLILSFLTENNNQKIILFNEGVGMLAGMITPFVFGPYLIATEVAWWVNEDKRKTKAGEELFEAFEFWAAKMGCKLITMVSLDDSVGKYYEKRGYKLYERAYMKII